MKIIKIRSGVLATIGVSAILLFCSSVFVFAKDNGGCPRYLEVFGKVQFQHKNLGGAVISVFCDSLEVEEHKAEANGRFDIKLDMNKVYYLHFSEQGMITKIVKITTVVPDTLFLAYQYEYKFNINLVQDFQGDDKIEAFKKPVAKIMYNKKYDGFDYDEEYNREVSRKMISLKLLPDGSPPHAFNNGKDAQSSSF